MYNTVPLQRERERESNSFYTLAPVLCNALAYEFSGILGLGALTLSRISLAQFFTESKNHHDSSSIPATACDLAGYFLGIR